MSNNVDQDSSKTNLESYSAPRSSRVANPAPLALFSFASTTFILSLYNLQTRSITHPNVVVGMAIFCGGLAQLLAGMWDFARGNVFGATAFTSYGAFWMSYGTIHIPGSGVLAAFANVDELQSALGIYLIAWFMLTCLLLVGSFRKNVGLVALFTGVAVTFLLLAVGAFTSKVGITKAGGATGTVASFIAYYLGLVDLLAADGIILPVGKFSAQRVNIQE